MSPDNIARALQALRAGRPIVVVDDEDRENEGDLILAGELATPQTMGFLVRHSSGLVCAPMPADWAQRLQLPAMVPDNQDPKRTAYTLTCDAMTGIDTGISAHDRARTLRVLADPDSTAADIYRPGHVLPLIARPGGVLDRPGHTEAAVDLCRLAGLAPVAAIGEVVHDDGSMMRLEALTAFAAEHDLVLVRIEELQAHRRLLGDTPTDPAEIAPVERTESVRIATDVGVFEAVAWRIAGVEHLSLQARGAQPEQPPLVRVHSECATGDVFGSRRCDCGEQLREAMARVQASGGVIIYLRDHEGRGIGLVDKLRAYHLQDEGADTVAANELLGLPSDRRRYEAAAQILAALGMARVRLLTNNPEKVAALRACGIEVAAREPLEVAPRAENLRYLRTKRDRMGHTLTHADLSTAK